MKPVCSTWLAVLLPCASFGVATPAAVPPETLPAVQAKMYPGAPIETAKAGTNGWVAIDYVKDIEGGSALDFSGWGILDGPAGKYGHVVARNGHFEFERRPGVSQRFYGANLCFSSCFPSEAETDQILTRLERLGYNTFRLHHYDRDVFRCGNNPPCNLDRLDRLIAEAGRRGFHITIDLFTVRPVKWRDCGIDRDGEMHFNAYKVLVSCHDGAYRDWERFARRVMAHRNPYNGLTWAEDPAIAFVDLVNEGCVLLGGNLADVRKGRIGGKPRIEEEWLASPIVIGAWTKWLAEKRVADPGYAPDVVPERFPNSSRHPAALAFVCDMERRLVTRQKAFLASIGCKALVTSNNNCGRDLPGMQRVAKDLYDYRDTHFYHDHCIGVVEQNATRPPLLYPLTNPYTDPYLMMTRAAFERIPEMPFAITEFDFPVPSPYRATGTIMTAALASLQDWDGLWHFAYSHNLKFHHDGYGIPQGYNLATDPIGQMADRVFSSVFLRRDMKPLAPAWTMDLSGATPEKHPRGEEWNAAPKNGLPGWNWADSAWRVRVGSSFGVPDGWKGMPREKAESPSGLLPIETFADDPQFAMHRVPADNPHFTLATSGTCAGSSGRHRDVITAGALSFRIGLVPATVACVSLDSKPISQSARLLVMHLTDAIGEGTRIVRGIDRSFNGRMYGTKMVLNWGKNEAPILVKDGYADIDLALDRPGEYEVYALATSGKRMEKLPSSVANGKLHFVAKVKGPDGKGRLAYEVVRAKEADVMWTRVIAQEEGRQCSWPTVAKAADGSIVAVFSGDREAHICPWGKIQMVKSTDGGETWCKPRTIGKTKLDDRDTGIVRLPDGRLFVTWFNSVAYRTYFDLDTTNYPPGTAKAKWQEFDRSMSDAEKRENIGYYGIWSSDNGETWTRPEKLVSLRSHTPHGPICLKNGTLLQFGRRFDNYLKWMFTPKYREHTTITVEQSVDGGRTWKTLCDGIADSTGENDRRKFWFHEPHVAELPNGELYALIRADWAKDVLMRQTRSADGGKTWEPITPSSLSGLPPHLLVLSDGRLLAVYGRRTENRGGYGEYASVSSDGGRTWDFEVKLSGSSNRDLGYPTSIEIDPGVVLTVYYQQPPTGGKPCIMATKWKVGAD